MEEKLYQNSAMEDLLAFLDDHTIACKLLAAEGGLDRGHLLVVDGHAALLYQTAGLALRGSQTALHQQAQHVDGAAAEVVVGQLGGGHMLGIACTGEQCLRCGTGLLSFLLTVDQLGQLIGQNVLGLVELGAFPGGHGVDLLQRQEGQHTDALQHVGVIHIAPVLEELEGAGLVGIQPHSAAGGLAHLLALGVQQQGDGHGVGVLAQLSADQLGTAQHVAPLVVAAELHVAAIVLEHVVEIVALHDHVVEFQEAETLLHALLVALGTQHVVDGEACAHLAQHFDIVQGLQPLGVIQHQGLTLGEVDELLHLALEALGIVLDGLLGQHLAHVGTAGGVSDQRGAVADEGDGLVARHLQALHQGQGHEMTRRQRVRRAVKADVKGSLAVVDHFTDLFLVGDLCDQATGHQLFINSHRETPCLK